MKFIHLSDLHIGKRVNEFSMIEDQKYILKKILQLIEAEQPDGVILAGDIYDKQIPSAEAVQVFDDFLTCLAVPDRAVFVISGNHDSAERIAFGARLMSGRGVYLSPVYDGEAKMVSLSDQYGEVCVYLLPFVKPATVRHAFPDETIESYHDAVAAAVRHMNVNPQQRNILAAHQFVTGALRCDSEVFSVGGVDNVAVTVFDEFDYVALGHIHSPQSVGRETVRYCGTPLKYSFSEANQDKGMTVLEMKEKGNIQLRVIPLMPLHDMNCIKGKYLEITELSYYQGLNRNDYYQITLTDEEDIPDAVQKLRLVYPNLMRLEYDNRRTRENQFIEGAEAVEQSELELFEEFYQLQNNQPMSEQQLSLSRELVLDILEKPESVSR